jgi:hypothetical protein
VLRAQGSGARTSRWARRALASIRRLRHGETAIAAATAIGAELVGVDLLPVGPGQHVVLELNGAVDFAPVYGTGVFSAACARSCRGS